MPPEKKCDRDECRSTEQKPWPGVPEHGRSCRSESRAEIAFEAVSRQAPQENAHEEASARHGDDSGQCDHWLGGEWRGKEDGQGHGQQIILIEPLAPSFPSGCREAREHALTGVSRDRVEDEAAERGPDCRDTGVDGSAGRAPRRQEHHRAIWASGQRHHRRIEQGDREESQWAKGEKGFSHRAHARWRSRSRGWRGGAEGRLEVELLIRRSARHRMERARAAP